MSFYLDASVLIRAFDGGDEAMRQFIESADEPLLVSSFAVGEVGSVVSRLVRMGELDSEDGRVLLAEFDAWCEAATVPVDTDTSDIRAAGRIIRRFDLKTKLPDTVHLVSAERREATLVTSDRKLAAAANKHGVTTICL